jgi:TolB protein
MKVFLCFILLCSISLVSFSQNPVGIFQNHEDIGHPKLAGSARYDEATQSYFLKGSGYNIWFNRDEFQYLYKKISGDFVLTADFEFIGDTAGAIGHRKIGWMIRESTDEAAASMNACKHIDGLVVLQWRPFRGMYMRDPEDEIFAPKKGGQVIQLERTGKKVTMRIAHPGEPLQYIGSEDLSDMKDTVLAGLYICSHDSSSVAEARIWNVRIDKPVISEYSSNPHVVPTPVRGVFGCRLEILDVFNGARKIIHESSGRFEAPNWMPDGKKLLFNEGGSMYTIPIEGGTPEKLNTGSVIANNNDHGISFDGKNLAISSHRQGLPGGGSTVYIVPLEGGEPRLLTPNTPSYWHGWNPNNKEVAYVAQRHGGSVYNIYKMPVNGGEEIQLTFNTSGHVDGPEYSPDGKFIYYNANASGTMQIWRMKPDGSNKEQVTFDQYHNWFPHLSPDGKWIAFISFPENIDPNSHPSYKQVMLRLMPAVGGSPRVIAYLYGGQGTINAPSWSPNSKQIAFVSNSEKFEK